MARYLFLIFIALIWGSQFVFNKLAVMVFSPLVVSWFRCVIGALTLTAFIKLTREPNPKVFIKLRYWTRLNIIGFFEATLPFILIVSGQQYVNSAVTAVIMAMVAIFTLLLILMFVPHEKVTLGKAGGIVLGFVAVLVLFSKDLMASVHMFSSLWAELAILVGAFSFALSLVMIKSLDSDLPPMRTARDILICAGVQTTLLIFILRPTLWHGAVPSSAWFSVLYLGVFAGGVVYLLYISLIRKAGAAFAGLSNYLVPLVGVGIGVVFMGDTLSWNALVALVLLVIAMAVVEWKR